jgi:hypothetical protein
VLDGDVMHCCLGRVAMDPARACGCGSLWPVAGLLPRVFPLLSDMEAS